jgi:hypothetical protein
MSPRETVRIARRRTRRGRPRTQVRIPRYGTISASTFLQILRIYGDPRKPPDPPGGTTVFRDLPPAAVTEDVRLPMTTRLIALTLALFVSCSPTQNPVAAGAQAAPLPTGTLDQLLAPIALYPDALLAQMLMSATDPVKITELDAWLTTNQTLKGTALQDAAVKAGFDASFVALTLFPQVVAKMADQIAWTKVLGQAFTSDKSAVFASIQKLRAQAQKVGTLKSSAQQEVETKKTADGQDVIVIEPTNPQIVYVPQYNTQVVYTQPPTTVVVVEEDDDADEAIAAGLIGFTAGIVIGSTMDNNYYYGPYGFHGGAYMYNDAWDDYYDHREDAREDWQDHREDLGEERTDRAENRSEQRTDRTGTSQEQRTERTEARQENRPASQTQRTTPSERASTQGATAQTSSRTGSAEARGYGEGSRSQAAKPAQRSGGSDAFSGYSSGQSQRSSSARGQSSRGSSRGGGGRRR